MQKNGGVDVHNFRFLFIIGPGAYAARLLRVPHGAFA